MLTCSHSPATLLPSRQALVKNHRILVVDDNEAIHKDFHKILGVRAGEEFDVEEAAG